MAVLKLLILIQPALVFCLRVVVRRSAEDLISAFPSDTEAEIGQSVTMYCRINHVVGNEIEWHHTPYGLQKLNAVYLGGFIYSNYRDRFAVTGDAQQGDRILKISNVSFEDAGKYICMHETESHTIELIVFATFPSSQSCAAIIPKDGLIVSNVCRLEPTNVTISCNYSYRGNLVPAVEWKDGKGSLLQSTTTHRADVNTSTLIHKALKNDTITSHINYLSSDFQSKFTWTVSIYVQNISHDNTVHKMGCDSRTIYCAKPLLPYQCDIEWKSSNGMILPNATLYTAGLLSSLYKCSAQCNIRGKTCSIQQLTVDLNCPESSASTNPSPNPTGESGSNIILVVIPVLVVVIITAVLVFVFRKRISLLVMQSRRRDIHETAEVATINVERNPMLTKTKDKTDEELAASIKDPIGHRDVLLESKPPYDTDVNSDVQDRPNASSC